MFFLLTALPPRSTSTDPLFPYPTRFGSAVGAEQVLDAAGYAFERAGLALGKAFRRLLRHRQRPLRGFGDEAVERSRRLDRANVIFRQFGRRDVALAQCVASLGDR